MDDAAALNRRAALEVLSCAALTPELWSVLVFDPEPLAFDWLTQAAARALAAATGTEVRQVRLGPATTEDALWSAPVLRHDDEEFRIAAREGALAPRAAALEPRLVMVSDLTRLSLAAARASVVLTDAPVAHVERHGRQRTWQPRLCWLAGCATQDLGRVSPHLLDRFALRIDGRALSTGFDKSADVLERWSGHQARDGTDPLPPDLASSLQAARGQHPATKEPTTTEHVLTYFDRTGEQGFRRPLALARLARACARLAGAAALTPEHVDQAARLIGLSRPTTRSGPGSEAPREPTPTPLVEPDARARPSAKLADDSGAAPAGAGRESVATLPVLEAGPSEVLEAASLPDGASGGAVGSPYREDGIEPQRESSSLRLPWSGQRATRSGRGVIVGVEQASYLRDLAVVETLLAASKFQRIRRQSVPPSARRAALLLSPRDLRQYRRAVEPEQMLALLLDHTCRDGWAWLDALLPYLRWAYTSRAKVCLVQVGRRAAPDRLQAERTIARNVLDPRVRAAFEAPAGTATPLAHGLDLLFQTLRHAMQHDRTPVREVWLVVVTDGRGNVPLKDSHAGSERSPIAGGDGPPLGRAGVDDALRMAGQLGSLPRVQKVLLDPAPTPYPELPTTLAEALRAVLVASRTPEAEPGGVGHVG